MENNKINQTAKKGAIVSQQIGEQTNYNGLSLDDALKIATTLFENNFPKLEDMAKRQIEQRIEEFKQSFIVKCAEQKIVDFSAFSDPDVQCVFYEAQKNYARFGTADRLPTLSSLLINRLKKNGEDLSIKIAINQAIEIAGYLSQEHLDYLSLTFLLKEVKLGGIETKEQFEDRFAEIARVFSGAKLSSFEYLRSMGCLDLYVKSTYDCLMDTYPFMKKERWQEPKVFQEIHADYETSHMGKIFAVMNCENKTDITFDLKTWIHD